MRRFSLVILAAVFILGAVSAAWASEWGTFRGFPKARIMLDGQVAKPSSPAIVVDGTTYVPLRFVSESLGANIDWDAGTYTVEINSKTSPHDIPVQDQIEPVKEELSDIPTWLKEFGSVEINGQKYEGVLITQDNEFYWEDIIIQENFPEAEDAMGEMDSRYYNDKKYINLRQILSYFRENGIGYDFKMYSSQPPDFQL